MAALAEAPPLTNDWPYRYDVLPIDQLTVDSAYQRPLTSFVKRIEKGWNPALVGTLIVSQRKPGRYAVVDGQTRMEGAKLNGVHELPCLVYEDLTRAQEADLFALLQTERRGMVAANRFRAEVIAKKPDAMAVERIANEAGFTIGTNVANGFEIQAVGALEQVYRGGRSRGASWEANPELLRTTLKIVKGAWPKMPLGAKSGTLIRGLAHFLMNGPKNIEVTRLTDRLSAVTPSALATRADQLREGRGLGGSSPRFMSEAIGAQYQRRG